MQRGLYRQSIPGSARDCTLLEAPEMYMDGTALGTDFAHYYQVPLKAAVPEVSFISIDFSSARHSMLSP